MTAPGVGGVAEVTGTFPSGYHPLTVASDSLCLDRLPPPVMVAVPDGIDDHVTASGLGDLEGVGGVRQPADAVDHLLALCGGGQGLVGLKPAGPGADRDCGHAWVPGPGRGEGVVHRDRACGGSTAAVPSARWNGPGSHARCP